MNFLDKQTEVNPPTGKRFLVWLTHDVDRLQKTFLHSLYYSFQQKRVTHLMSHLRNINPYWNFEKILDIESSCGVKSTFFFLNETMRPTIFKPRSFVLATGRYNILEPKIKDMVKRIDENGWEIGLHGSYHSYNSESLLAMEKGVLEDILGHSVSGIRQHYLNLLVPTTWEIHESIGFQYDASFGLKNDVGFRGEVYYPFRPFESKFTVFPVAIIDKSLFEKHQDLNAAWQDCLDMIRLAETKKTLLTVLWHQRVFDDHDFPGHIEIYRRLIEECQSRKGHFCTGQDVFQYLAGWF
jgi:peptidoglycan/xylan/chitin deacetylase (PgdA/CDA1 family)